MRQLSVLVVTAIVLAVEANKVLNPKDLKPCPDGDGLYAVGCNNKYLQCVNNVEFEQSCPEGLYFDRLMARCERRAANHLCNAENRRTLNVRQKAVSINCVGRLSGDYPLDKNVCNENYYQCANGISYMRKCPHNQVYSPVLKRCDYLSNCDSSNGVKQQAAAAYASPTYDADKYVVTTKEFENGHNGIDCTVLDNSYISNENDCSPYFYQCANGKLFRKTCPEGLIYVLSQNLCDYPQGVKSCPEYDGSETSYVPPVTTTQAVPTAPAYEAPVHSRPYTPAAAPTAPAYVPRRSSKPARYNPVASPPAPIYTPSQTPTVAPYVPAEAPSAPVYAQPASYQPAVHGDCTNKGDGFFEIKSCNTDFLSCSNGHGRIVTCASNLVFDARVASCDHLEACKGPRTQDPMPNLYNHGGAYNEKPAEIKIHYDCSGKANGEYFEEACTKNYIRCHDGRAFVMSCPADLVYNKATSSCDYADNCEKNYMEPSQIYGGNDKPATTVGDEAPVVYTTQPPRTVAYTQPPRDTERPSTVYGGPVYTKAPSTGFEQPTTTPVVYTSRVPTSPIPTDDFSCTNLIDGDHASGSCKSVYFTCSNNKVTATKCPGNLVFNPYLGQCDYETNVRDCQGYQPAETTTPSYSYSQGTTKGYAPTVSRGYASPATPGHASSTSRGYVPTTKAPWTPGYSSVTYATTQPPKYAAFCEILADGNYGHKCENYFYQCYNFETYKVPCQPGLYYSLKNDKCDYKQNVEGCPEYKPTPTTTPAAEQPQTQYGYKVNKYPNIDYTPTTPGPIDTSSIAEAFSCYGRPDGIYALPYCSKDFVQCIDGRSLIASCSGGLFYSEKTGLCDYKSNVDICQVRKGSDVIGNNACLNKADGSYSAGCSSHYFSCSYEKVHKMVCPNKLKFSEKKGFCVYPIDATECSIQVKPDRDIPAVPSDFCTIRQNGLHGFKQCSPHYIACDNKRAILGTCAAPLTFNGHNQLCDYKSNNKECGSDYIPPTTTATSPYNSYTTKAYEQPTTTSKPYQPQPITTSNPIYKAETTTTARPYQQPVTTTTTATPYYRAESTTTRQYQQPSTTTTPYQAPTITTVKPYQTVATTTPARDVEIPTTTGHTSYEETTTTPARDVTTTTTAPYVPPTTTSSRSYY